MEIKPIYKTMFKWAMCNNTAAHGGEQKNPQIPVKWELKFFWMYIDGAVCEIMSGFDQE
jgi:hypothetical protein